MVSRGYLERRSSPDSRTVRQTIDLPTLHALGMGAAVLSAGGGSYPYLECLVARDVLSTCGDVPMIDVSTLKDNTRVAMVCMAGAPLPLFERFVDADHFTRPVRALEQRLGQRFEAIAGYEIGSMNGIIPVIIAAKTGLPLLDVDTFGRSFPEGRMTSFALAGVDMTPMALSDIRDNDVIIENSVNGDWTETILRSVTTSYGSIAALASATNAGTLKRHGIAGTYSRAIRLGSALLEAQATRADWSDLLTKTEQGLVLARGRIADVERTTTGGFVRGKIRIDDTKTGASVSVHFQNEYAVVEQDGNVISTVPDLICVFDSERGEPIGTEALRYAQAVTVISMPPAAIHLTGRALRTVGPRGFGYDFDYQSPHKGGAA